MIPLKDTLRPAPLILAAILAVGAGPALAQPPPGLPAVPTTRILAVGHATPKFSPQALRTILPQEVRDTVKLYLQGKIADWYTRKDRPGVVFLLNVSDPKEAQQLLDGLPFGREGIMEFDLVPLGPLAPLGVLIAPPAG